MLYSLSSKLYRLIAARLLEALADRTFFSGSLTVEYGEVDCRLTGSFIVYRTPLLLPEGTGSRIVDVVPVWWECHTLTDVGEVDNDFSFGELRPLLTD